MMMMMIDLHVKKPLSGEAEAGSVTVEDTGIGMTREDASHRVIGPERCHGGTTLCHVLPTEKRDRR
jgi:hypothetical protein